MPGDAPQLVGRARGEQVQRLLDEELDEVVRPQLARDDVEYRGLLRVTGDAFLEAAARC
jgi:hypothetical protein